MLNRETAAEGSCCKSHESPIRSPSIFAIIDKVFLMAANGKYVTLTDANFEEEVLQADEPVLVDFWATWCGPCRAIAPTIEELAGEFEGRAKVAKLDVDDNPQTAMNFNVRSIPTLLFFKDGQVAEQLVGAVPKKKLAAKLEELSGQPA